ncbi:MAG: dTMP kinase [Microgenomates group bacterium]
MKEKVDRLTINYNCEMHVNPYPGMLVALEGLDGSGSSTQARDLVDYLFFELSLNTWLTKEPTEGPIGAPIRHILSRKLEMDSQTLQMMFTTDRSDHLNESRGIITRLKNKSLVITDRYLWSTLAYGYAADLGIDWLLAMQSRFPLPDLTFFLDTPVDICLTRMQESRLGLDLFEKKEKLEKAYKGYMETILRFPEHFIVIDGKKTPDLIRTLIRREIERHPKFSSLARVDNNIGTNPLISR